MVGTGSFNEQDTSLLLNKADSIFTIADKNNDKKLDAKETNIAKNIFSEALNFIQKARLGLSQEEGWNLEFLLKGCDIALEHADKMPILDEDFNSVNNPDGNLRDNKISGNEYEQYKTLLNHVYATYMEDSPLASYNLKFHPADANMATIDVEGETIMIMRDKNGGYTIMRANAGEAIAHSKTYKNLEELMFDLQNLANMDPPFGTYKGLDMQDYY